MLRPYRSLAVDVIARCRAAARRSGGIDRAAQRGGVDAGLRRLLDDAADQDREVRSPVEDKHSVLTSSTAGTPGVTAARMLAIASADPRGP